MPELPEVETVRRTLAPVVGATIERIWTSGKPLRLNRAIPVAALRTLVGHRITGLRRLGKYLLVDVNGPRGLLVHLGMSGSFRIHRAEDPREPHTHVIVGLGARELRFVDPRRFGQVDVFTAGAEREHPSLAVLGPDPIAESVDGAHLHARSRGRATQLKTFLLDQKNLAGVGNIYAVEALWRAKLRPSRPAKRLTVAQAVTLAQEVRAVFEFALEHGGTSLRDFVDGSGQAGENAEYLVVYGREGTPCPRCQTLIRRTVTQGRATYFCPTCQVL
ncbi:MAG: bifunctional DNA-formamidopyrimidine glycosylase/DNA-(apurinic or apyrimidinic site) lyase [Deltaproteobacteria bacterium]|nr:bifunctional DNA-formamidopyrimidine glycosylase/DNA-(apurinic or apyrimidinic site) lyase [Deltaproteobacteria bacterium]